VSISQFDRLLGEISRCTDIAGQISQVFGEFAFPLSL